MASEKERLADLEEKLAAVLEGQKKASADAKLAMEKSVELERSNKELERQNKQLRNDLVDVRRGAEREINRLNFHYTPRPEEVGDPREKRAALMEKTLVTEDGMAHYFIPGAAYVNGVLHPAESIIAVPKDHVPSSTWLAIDPETNLPEGVRAAPKAAPKSDAVSMRELQDQRPRPSDQQVG